MELRGVKVSVGTKSAGTPYVLPLSLAEPLAARLVLPAPARTPRLAEPCMACVFEFKTVLRKVDGADSC